MMGGAPQRGAPSTASLASYGSPTTEVLGNTATISSGYTPWTNDLTSRQVVKGSTLQSLAYQWDKNGNLEKRQDLLQNLTEVFTYLCPCQPPASAAKPMMLAG